MATEMSKTTTPSQNFATDTKQNSRKKGLSRKAQKNIAFYIFISPWLLGFIFLILLPLLGGLVLSFTNYDGLNWVPFGDTSLNTIKFTGMRNYTRIFADEDAMYSLRRVLIWTALNTPIWLIISFSLAYLLNQKIKGRSFFRTVFYLPSVVPIVAISVVAIQLFHNVYGLINQFVGLFIPGFIVNWLTEFALPSVTSMAVWTGIGGGMIIFLAGLQAIPDVYEEAAVVDGATKFQRFRLITIPLMTPLIFYQLILSLVVALQYYALPLLMSQSAGSTAGLLSSTPQRDVYLYMIHALRQAFTYQRYGYSLALTWFLVIIIIVATFVLFRTSSLWVYYENE